MFFIPPEVAIVQPAERPERAPAGAAGQSPELEGFFLQERLILTPGVLENELSLLLNDPARLADYGRDPRILSRLEAEQLSDTALVARAVVLFSVAEFPSAAMAHNLREGLGVVLGRSTEPYARSVARLYSVLPTPTVIASIEEAPATAALLEAKRHEAESRPVEGFLYPEGIRKLQAKLQGILDAIPSAEVMEVRLEASKEFKPSPFMEKVLEIESQGMAPEIVARARAELAEIVRGSKEALEAKMRAQERKLTPPELLETIYRYLKDDFKTIEGAQPFLLDGLASHVFDCDVYTLVYMEIGKQFNLPMHAVFIADRSKPGSIAHCAPGLLLKKGEDARLLVWECREPIEKLADGTERRLYKTPDEMRTRINRLAGEELIPEREKPFILRESEILAIEKARKEALAKKDSAEAPAPR